MSNYIALFIIIVNAVITKNTLNRKFENAINLQITSNIGRKIFRGADILVSDIPRFRQMDNTTFEVGGKEFVVLPVEPFYGAPKIRDLETTFNYNGTEYILFNVLSNQEDAFKLCEQNYRAKLAKLPTIEEAGFMSDALAETILTNSSIWTAGKIEEPGSKKLFWFDNEKKLEEIKPEILRLLDTRKVTDRDGTYYDPKGPISKNDIHSIVITRRYQVITKGMDCLSFDRKFRKIPRFRPTPCNELNSILCERLATKKVVKIGSTHPGWIQVDNTFYKIYGERETWENARQKCIAEGAILTTMPHYRVCQILGRYLIIGRPSLRNAWIGARFMNGSFSFLGQNDSLPKEPNSENYPPWRDGHMQRSWGCLLLDRETSTGETFLEAHCERKRAYICSRNDSGRENPTQPIIVRNNSNKADTLIDNNGFRLYHQQVSWEEARNKCNSYNNTYQGKLVEVREKYIINHLLRIAVENKISIKYLWIGAKYNIEKKMWQWDSDNETVSSDTIPLVVNQTYSTKVDEQNLCLTMQRENVNEALFYGTRCDWGQYFVCMFPRDNFFDLLKKEKQKTKS